MSDLMVAWASKLLEFTTTSFAIKNYLGIFLDVNPAFCRLTGFARDELIGAHHSIITAPADRERTDAVLRLFAAGQVSDHSWMKHYVRKDGTVIHCHKKLTVLDPSDPDGKLIIQIEDVTEEESFQAQREQALRALSQEYLRESITLRSIGDAVISTDCQGLVELLNPAAEALTGWTWAEAKGHPVSQVFRIVNASSGRPVPSPVDEVLASGRMAELASNTLLISKSGQVRAISDSAAPIQDGLVRTGVVLIFRDITERLALLDQARNAERLESLGLLAGGIAHDFNNLLSGLFANLDLLRSVCEPEGRQNLYLTRALRAFERAKGLTRQLLTFAKGGEPIRTPGRLDVTVRESADFGLSGTDVACSLDLEPEIPVCDYDANMIGQVLGNLLMNAHQSQPVGCAVRISVRQVTVKPASSLPVAPGPYVEVVVQDNGPGIPPEVLPKIFDPFFTTKPKGHGLGLATTRSILERHNGTIVARSLPGEGARFSFYLPVSRSEIDTGQPPSDSYSGSGRVLVMDDEESIRDVLGEMLTSMGFDVTAVTEGTEAIAAVEASLKAVPIRAYFVDLTIRGGLGGRETLRRIRDLGVTAPIVLVSGYSDDSAGTAIGELGPGELMRKPFLRADVVAVLERHLVP